ncbi:MAG: FAD-dependent oxidoreductase [Planctomycetia bacterium]|nr:FAD-dependent oxidoreductase [Planctomycetia bacterium]
MSSPSRPVVILGAGVNGAALARELLLNGVPVVIVEANDICFGATAYSSRLIHGGLRYLEFGDLALVRESLAERSRLLRLAPQFVHPLRLHIPVAGRLGGWWGSASRMLGGVGGVQAGRGMWLVRTGLQLYDYYARDPQLPRHSILRVGQPGAPVVDAARYQWLCAYSDAQMRLPERFVQALLADARALAAAAGVEFRLVNYHRARLTGSRIEIFPTSAGDSVGEAAPFETIEPCTVVNATGAWVDLTLQELKVATAKLMAGTKGTHFITFHAGLRQALAGQSIYVEADDGRPMFVLPFGPAVLVGTTDIPHTGRPELALASDEELDYLVNGVNHVFPQVKLARTDLELHYCGVRPLPASTAATPAAVSRRHKLVEHVGAAVPLYSMVGGKLTTCRQLAEETTGTLLARLDLPRRADSQNRVVPGGQDYPQGEENLLNAQSQLAGEFGLSEQQVAAAWPLFGTRLKQVLAESSDPRGNNLDNTQLPVALARWIIEHEWVRTLDDLVERRLMLLYHRPLTAIGLRQLAELLHGAGMLAKDQIDVQIAATTERLRTHFGKSVL